jgi:hypothetical protein
MTRSLKLAALALMGVMILWACGGEALGAKETAEKFLKAMKTGDFDTAKGLATKEAAASIDMMAGMAGDSEGGNADDIVMGDVKEDGDKAVATYTDAGKEMTLNLVKVDGEWKAAWEKGGPADNSSPLNDLSNELEGALDEAMEEVGDAMEGEEEGHSEGDH